MTITLAEIPYDLELIAKLAGLSKIVVVDNENNVKAIYIT